MAEHIQVELRNLRFGHEAPNHPGNARTAGREEGIAELAAHIFARGKIDDLLVYDDGVPGVYFVSNGNRSLAALRMIHTAESDELIDCKLTTAERAYEDSLAVAVLAKKFHPVDEFEGYAKLRDDLGKTEEEIARQYGKTSREVKQILALGRLSPKIRQAWRAGDIKAEVAQAFTLALDHDTQDKKFDELSKAHALTAHNVKRELGAYETEEDVTQLLDVVGDQAYVDAGGRVTRDLFGRSHIISNPGLLKQMARHIMIAKCEQLVDAGWGWAEMLENLPAAASHWPISDVKAKDMMFEGNEEERLKVCKARLAEIEAMDEYDDAIEQEQENLQIEIGAIDNVVRGRSYPEKKRKQLGCIVQIEDGKIVVLAGVKRPAEATPAPEDEREPDAPAKPTAASKPAAARGEAPEPDISNAMLHRLSLALTNAAATSLIQDEKLALSVLLAGFDCFSSTGVRVSVSGLGLRGSSGKLLGAGDITRALALAIQLKPNDRIALLAQVAAGALDFQNASLDDKAHDGAIAICNAIEPKVLNAALRGAFDAKDYFNSVSAKLCMSAISEALGADLARQQANKPKAEIAAFAIENVPETGWLPLQLRAKGYDGPPAKKVSGKVSAIAEGRKKPAKGKTAGTAKRAAAAKKSAKKTSKKKR